MHEIAVVAHQVAPEMWLMECSECGILAVCPDIGTDAFSIAHLDVAHQPVSR